MQIHNSESVVVICYYDNNKILTRTSLITKIQLQLNIKLTKHLVFLYLMGRKRLLHLQHGLVYIFS